ncbi:hypothetical protein V8F33_007091 [Rhypophila sp. PSN 637]
MWQDPSSFLLCQPILLLPICALCYQCGVENRSGLCCRSNPHVTYYPFSLMICKVHSWEPIWVIKVVTIHSLWLPCHVPHSQRPAL